MDVRRSAAVRRRARDGTPPRLRRRKGAGALPSSARPKSIRPVENTPELADEAAAVVTTTFTTDAAAASPSRENIVTNGEAPLRPPPQGTTVRMASNATK